MGTIYTFRIRKTTGMFVAVDESRQRNAKDEASSIVPLTGQLEIKTRSGVRNLK